MNLFDKETTYRFDKTQLKNGKVIGKLTEDQQKKLAESSRRVARVKFEKYTCSKLPANFPNIQFFVDEYVDKVLQTNEINSRKIEVPKEVLHQFKLESVTLFGTLILSFYKLIDNNQGLLNKLAIERLSKSFLNSFYFKGWQMYFKSGEFYKLVLKYSLIGIEEFLKKIPTEEAKQIAKTTHNTLKKEKFYNQLEQTSYDDLLSFQIDFWKLQKEEIKQRKKEEDTQGWLDYKSLANDLKEGGYVNGITADVLKSIIEERKLPESSAKVKWIGKPVDAWRFNDHFKLGTYKVFNLCFELSIGRKLKGGDKPEQRNDGEIIITPPDDNFIKYIQKYSLD